jgi:hypothetical protein
VQGSGIVRESAAHLPMPARDLEIRCPECGVRIRVDAATGQVIAHGPGERPKDLDEAAARHQERKSGLGEAFGAALEAERGRKQELDDLFRRAAEKAAESDPEEGPEREDGDKWR